jgi:hypothetical protein
LYQTFSWASLPHVGPDGPGRIQTPDPAWAETSLRLLVESINQINGRIEKGCCCELFMLCHN